MRKRGFTLVELLTVIAIVGILYAIFMPVFKSARGAAFQYNASQTMRQLGASMAMYASDNDDSCPLALYPQANGLQTWFGFREPDGKVDRAAGLLSAYSHGKLGKDPTHNVRPWFGDNTGFGYNWGHIGSDSHERANPEFTSSCENAAHMSELSDPSGTIGFTTSAFYFAPWLERGDGYLYDCGFIYQNRYWRGNPPVDFRHQGARVVDKKLREVRNEGFALVLFMDGSTKARKEGQIKDGMFMRMPPRE
jgi:prepilin-type N-terminal cleavage/methylation domain-containing protein